MISIYLFTKRSQFISNKWFDSILFVFIFQKSYLHSFYEKNLLQKSQFDNKKNFTYFYYIKKKEWNFTTLFTNELISLQILFTNIFSTQIYFKIYIYIYIYIFL